jgi:hypothetical protein
MGMKHEHKLVDILFARHIWDESYKVARWCSECGAIVVDLDYDNRTAPGRIMPMRLPKNLKPAITLPGDPIPDERTKY